MIKNLIGGWKMRSFLAFLFVCLMPLCAQAAPFLQVSTVSWHLQPSSRQWLSDYNAGMGIGWRFNRTWAVSLGEYRNGLRRHSDYGYVAYTPLHLGPLSLGAAVGAVSGYPTSANPMHPWLAGAVATIRTPWRWDINVLALPRWYGSPGFVALQLNLPL